MCSVITHPVVPLALSPFLPAEAASPGLVLTAALCSAAPDLDVIGFNFGIRYGDLLGHRGFTHSIAFAAALAGLLTFTVFRASAGNHVVIFLFLFCSTLSHGVLDALTNGGLGVAFFSPFSNRRYFFPWHPIEVSPIGVGNFFSARGIEIMSSELKWVWVPWGAVFLVGELIKRRA